MLENDVRVILDVLALQDGISGGGENVFLQ